MKTPKEIEEEIIKELGSDNGIYYIYDLELAISLTFQKSQEMIREIIENITSWTCECGCVTFDNKKCRLCGKSPKYGEIDYEELLSKIGGEE